MRDKKLVDEREIFRTGPYVCFEKPVIIKDGQGSA